MLSNYNNHYKYLVFVFFCLIFCSDGSWFGWLAQMYRCGIADDMKVKAF